MAHNSDFTRSLDLSPDGRRLAYQTGSGRDTTFRTLNVRNGARTRFSLGKLGVGDVAWAPGGKRLAYSFLPFHHKREELRTIRPNGRGVRTVLTFPDSDPVSELAWQTR
jgi:WD40 repeat protein